jgi:hypothetical protein
MDITALQKYDSAIVASKLTISSADATTYCIMSTVGQATFKKAGPGAEIVTGSC